MSQHFGQIYLSHILHWTQSQFLRQFYSGDVANFVGSTIMSFSLLLSSFDDSAKLLRCRDGPSCCSSWGTSSLANVPDGIFFPLYLPSQLFRPYFAVTNLWMSRILRHLRFIGKLFSRVFSKLKVKVKLNKGEVNVVEITQIRLQKM